MTNKVNSLRFNSNDTVIQAKYFPGVVTSIAYVWIGAMVLQSVIRAWPRTAPHGRKHLAAA